MRFEAVIVNAAIAVVAAKTLARVIEAHGARSAAVVVIDHGFSTFALNIVASLIASTMNSDDVCES